ncbi:hypothetical protein B0J14DRAFT_545435 [Halenospora varia]|nr:hypothetical protein B0J14DRAFT_545435 [Halenospora varia]
MAEATEKQGVQDIRQVRPVRKVISYLETLDGSAHAALNSIGNGAVLDAPKSAYIVEPPLESLNDEAEQEAKLFTEALKSYESEVPKKYKTGINLDQTHSIGDVVKQIDSALKEYKHNTQNPVWEAIRRGFWKLSETKDGLENWLELLPSSSDYSSLIFGGLNLIIQAAGRIGDVRNETFKALSEIPFHLSSTRESVGIFAKSEALRKCGVKLYTVTLEALGHILRWFKKRAIGKAFAAFLKQDLYQRALLEKIGEIEIVSARFKHISMTCMQREVVSTRQTVTSLAAASDNNHLIIKSTIDQTKQTLEHLSLVDSKQHDITQQMLGGEFETWKTRYDVQLELIEKNTNVLNNCKTLLQSIYVALPLCFQSSKDPPSYEKNLEIQTASTRSSKLLSLLAPSNEISQTDLQRSLRGLNTLTRSEQDRAVWAMKSPLLRSWMLSTTSSTLLINGSCPSTRARSPINFVCARLVDSLKSQGNENFIILHFFCGQHKSSATDSNATPLGLINSLLAQLLFQFPDFEISQQDEADFSSNILDTRQQLFQKLVAQLEASMMVFCIIDGISLYEDATRLAETRKLMHGFTELVARDDGIGPVFKLLLTSPTRINNLPEGVAKDEILSVPREVPPQAGLSVLRNGKIRQNEINVG